MKIRTFAIALAVAGAPAALAAQQNPPPAPPAHGQHGEHGGPMGMRRPGGPRGGVEGLIARRQELGLTDAQVQRLQAIQQRAESQTRPLFDRLRALREQTPGLPQMRGPRPQPGQNAQPGQRPARPARPQLTDEQKQALQKLREQSKPIFDQLRQNREATMRDVQSVLTDQQKQKLQQWRSEHRGQRDGGEGHGRRGGWRGQRGQGEPRDTTSRS
jgi:Spy/CpxP family protein refolding chaperone